MHLKRQEPPMTVAFSPMMARYTWCRTRLGTDQLPKNMDRLIEMTQDPRNERVLPDTLPKTRKTILL